ncbi:hypothetical protein PUNSTDRAFT_130809 [Punctularia strigosozonata HHB-11173 SS5]|uniref:uncharacterized protein n=1 Tax=Punctularia strigosozonata (strain HHB-11173) TaxID=741275 RepID=UPI00044163EB|nr:uncharacterized protein PUNSTDRAFT_130809 [Punctularia strigosozonata HHB-11173 SS5]EIN12551.1 hypothetical protein PUNSTDRAFT_130809 [Punctularia strigosozonata HHB-11173 SS5]
MTTSGAAIDYYSYKVPQLKELCKERGLSGFWTLNKAAIIQKLRDAEAAAEPFSKVPKVGNANRRAPQHDTAASSSGAQRKHKGAAATTGNAHTPSTTLTDAHTSTLHGPDGARSSEGANNSSIATSVSLPGPTTLTLTLMPSHIAHAGGSSGFTGTFLDGATVLTATATSITDPPNVSEGLESSRTEGVSAGAPSISGAPRAAERKPRKRPLDQSVNKPATLHKKKKIDTNQSRSPATSAIHNQPVDSMPPTDSRQGIDPPPIAASAAIIQCLPSMVRRPAERVRYFKVPELPNKVTIGDRAVAVNVGSSTTPASARAPAPAPAPVPAHPPAPEPAPASARAPAAAAARARTPARAPAPASALVPASNLTSASVTKPLESGSAKTASWRRFKPIVPKRPGPGLELTAGNYVATQQNRVPSTILNLSYPDLPPAPPPPALVNITLPPKLAQRRSIDRWSIILSGLSDTERAKCTHVSRVFRYAVYLSAVAILERECAGRRLASVAACCQRSRTNMWPYLRQRRREAAAARAVFDNSFLGTNVFKGGRPIAKRLWTSPDYERQASVALRFVLSRVWFHICIGEWGGDEDAAQAMRPWMDEMVVDVQPVVKGAVWSVTVLLKKTGETRTCYVLEATAELIGRPEDPYPQQDSQFPVREDWFAYVQEMLRDLPEEGERPRAALLDRLAWQHTAEYDRGVSRLWLVRVGREGAVGEAKRQVAERYILASVVGNGYVNFLAIYRLIRADSDSLHSLEKRLSGRWMSNIEMAQESASLSSAAALKHSRAKVMPRVNLFLPAQHHVESVHFTASRGGGNLHPALAVVQAMAREVFVLRDNGMTVGCEGAEGEGEEGVARIWRAVLGCDSRGLAI